ncbi:MAG: helix-turn-helix transcriptional regulator [Actinobacteria bacterium]|nr:helix-turn-helix transcriptional regulator [Actinomycetota bacterium]
MELLRIHVGAVLRVARIEQSRTLRDVASAAKVSLGYLSEVERGQKEASSELLNSISQALGLSLSTVIATVHLSIQRAESPTLTVIDSTAA